MFDQLDLSALIKSVLVHLVILGMFFVSWKWSEDRVLPKTMPMHVSAVILDKKPQPSVPQQSAPQPKKPEPPKPQPKKPEPPKPAPKKPEPKKPEPKKPLPPPKKPEPKKPEPKKPEPKKPAPKQESIDFNDILQSEMKQLEKRPKPPTPQTNQAPAAAATSTSTAQNMDEIQQYLGLIQQTITRNWTRPPSARTGMAVTLRINLLPGGELNDVNIIESSGNAAFDRSAVQAVQKAGRFPVPSDPAKFDRNFRTLKLHFNPDDLLY